ncbi:hypothetical protein BDV26DRAFT_106112 [Aspergillus bertholletiae]|uniref:Uncharacterized protein n=1 Tax=Aspergillus bertholletiae TaxID=1226010 RepID=A0A5N7BH48_9EURO|nr:hypothetical protein BDV26DRAFT_106112 [Aspergillus bertholletiae]
MQQDLVKEMLWRSSHAAMALCICGVCCTKVVMGLDRHTRQTALAASCVYESKSTRAWHVTIREKLTAGINSV